MGVSNKIYTSLLLLVFLFLSSGKSSAQTTDVNFQKIFLEQGLSQSIVTCIAQDKDGFLFFGTEDGLNKFDGYTFKVFRNNPADVNSLSFNSILSLLVDHNNNLWIGTFNAGLNKLDNLRNNFMRFQHDPNNKNSISHDNITSLLEDNDGNIWIGTDNGLNKLIVINEKENKYEFEHFANNPEDSASLSSNAVLSIFQDKRGFIWVGTGNGLNRMYINQNNKIEFERFLNGNASSISSEAIMCMYEDTEDNFWIGTNNGLKKILAADKDHPKFIHYKNNPENRKSLSNNQIFALCEDNNEVLWIGTNGGGINLYDKKSDSFSHYLHNSLQTRTLSYNEIRALYNDKSGIMWIGTYGGGINKVSRGAKQFIHFSHIPNNKNSLSHDIIWAIYEDEDSVLWIGTHGEGLDKIDRKKHEYKNFKNIHGNPFSISSNLIRVIFDDGKGNLWLGTNGGGISVFNKKTGKCKIYRHNSADPNSLLHDEIRAIYRAKNGTIWIAVYGFGLDKFDEKTETFVHFVNDPADPKSLSNNFVRSIYEDNSGRLWIGTDGGGLNLLDREKGDFTSYSTSQKDSLGISNDYIFSIHEDKYGNIWLGTFGGGLNKFNPATGKFKIFTKENGLPSDAVYCIVEDEDENLWLSTNNGLSKFNPRTNTFKNYNINDGLQNNEFNGGSFFKGLYGELFFGGINGFNAFFPKNIIDNSYIPPVVITSFNKFNTPIKFEKPFSEIKEITLSHEDYIFSVEFTALDFTAPDKNKFAYKMEGLDEDWIFTSAQNRIATFTTLPPGEYIFKVKGSNSDGIWNEQAASLKIIITPPFWRSWWFVSLSGITMVSLGFLFYRKRLKNERLIAELKTAHDAQMSIMPHYDPKIKGLDISSACIPANEVGGDFFDYLWLDEQKEKFGILIGDVSGKAMKAAMTAIMASGMIISEANEADSVSTILRRVNIPLYYKTDRNMFTAVCLASINTITNELSFTNAGLSYPILKSNGSTKFLKSFGPRFPLGLLKNVEYEEQKVMLNKDDILIFMTDGVLDARNQSKEFYGEENLLRLLNKFNTCNMYADEIKDLIISDISDFTGTQKPYDDIALIVIKIG